MPRFEVQVHKVSGRRGAMARPGQKQWGPGDRREFHLVELTMTDADAQDVVRERKRVLPNGTLEDVAVEDWPETRAQHKEVEDTLRSRFIFQERTPEQIQQHIKLLRDNLLKPAGAR